MERVTGQDRAVCTACRNRARLPRGSEHIRSPRAARCIMPQQNLKDSIWTCLRAEAARGIGSAPAVMEVSDLGRNEQCSVGRNFAPCPPRPLHQLSAQRGHPCGPYSTTSTPSAHAHWHAPHSFATSNNVHTTSLTSTPRLWRVCAGYLPVQTCVIVRTIPGYAVTLHRLLTLAVWLFAEPDDLPSLRIRLLKTITFNPYTRLWCLCTSSQSQLPDYCSCSATCG